MLLLSSRNLDVVSYHTKQEDVTWKTSSIRSWLNGYHSDENQQEIPADDSFIGTAFSSGEQKIIVETELSNEETGSADDDSGTTDKIFLLSASDSVSGAYDTRYVDGGGKTGTANRNLNGMGSWWLRSSGTDSASVAYVGEDGTVCSAGYSVNCEDCAVRPSFLLKMSSILFTSGINGKTTNHVGSLSENGSFSGIGYQLTLLDESRKFEVTEEKATGRQGQPLTFHYTGAETGVGEYISAMIVNDGDEILYYGQLKYSTDDTATVDLIIPPNLGYGDYTVKFFNEQINGAGRTDFSSAFDEVPLTVVPEKTVTLGSCALGTDEYVYYGTYDNNPVKWHILSSEGNGGTYYSNASYQPVTEPFTNQLTDGKTYTDDDGTKFIYFKDDGDYHKEESDALFLLSEYALYETAYNGAGYRKDGQTYASDWHYSELWKWCNDTFLSESFTEAEQRYLLRTNKKSSRSKYTDELKGDAAFCLSTAELDRYAENVAKTVTYPAGNSQTLRFWWLRTPETENRTRIVNADNSIANQNDWSVADRFGIAARPALNLNLSSVLFTTVAGEKKTDCVGTLSDNQESTGNEYQLTMLDESRHFQVKEETADGVRGGTIELTYQDAETGNKEYISAMITDEKDEILYYGQLKAVMDSTEKNGTVRLTVPMKLADGTYTVKLFNEQINGDCQTDLSSDFDEMTLTVKPEQNVTLGTSALGADKYIRYGVYGGNTVTWHILSMDGSGGVYYGSVYLPEHEPDGEELTDGGVYTDGDGTQFIYCSDDQCFYQKEETDAMFLLSESAFETMPIELRWEIDDGDGQKFPVDWRYSDAWQWCHTTFAKNTFTEKEREGFLRTGKVNSVASSFTDELKGDMFFFLSIAEFDRYAGKAKRPSVFLDPDAIGWWLRSPFSGNMVAYVKKDDGNQERFPIGTQDVAARPAVNVNLLSVLFTTAVNGKASDVGTLLKNSEHTDQEYQLTMLDETRSFKVEETDKSACQGETVTFSYRDAETGENEFLSAMITNDGGEVLYYGKLKHLTDSTMKNGTVCLTVPDEMDVGEYTVKLFNEQINGNGRADFSGTFQTVTLIVGTEIKSSVLQAKAENGKTTAKIFVPEAGCYTILFADYENGSLKKLASVPFVTTEKNCVVRQTADILLSTGDKILVRNQLSDMTPLCEAYLLP